MIAFPFRTYFLSTTPDGRTRTVRPRLYLTGENQFLILLSLLEGHDKHPQQRTLASRTQAADPPEEFHIRKADNRPEGRWRAQGEWLRCLILLAFPSLL